MTDRPQMFAHTRRFSGMADSMEPCTMLWGRPLLPWQRNLGKLGLFFDKIAYKSACMQDRPDMFGPTRGDDQRGQSLLQWQRHLRSARSLIAYRLVHIVVCFGNSKVWSLLLMYFTCTCWRHSSFILFSWAPIFKSILWQWSSRV